MNIDLRLINSKKQYDVIQNILKKHYYTPLITNYFKTNKLPSIAFVSYLLSILYQFKDSIILGKEIKKKIPAEEYLKAQKRFKHLLNTDEGHQAIEKIQALADQNIERYGLLKTEAQGEEGKE